MFVTADPRAQNQSTGPEVHDDRGVYRPIFERMPNGMAYCRVVFERGKPRDLLFLYTNPAFEVQTGLWKADGKRLSELVPRILDSDEELLEVFGRIARGGAPERFEIYVHALTAWLSISAYSPEREHLVAVFDDITERKLSEEMLHKSEERYRDIFDNTSDLIQCLAPDGTFLYTNRAWRDAMGYTEQEVRSLNLLDVLHPESALCCQDRFKRLLNGETMTCITFKFVTRSGKTVHLSGDCGSIIKANSVISTRGIFRNITDTVEAEAALKASEARYQALYENAPDIYTTLNTAGEVLSINGMGAKMLGYEVGELVGESTSRIIHPEDQADVFAYIARQFAEPEKDPGIEYRQVRKDGSIIWVHQRVTLYPDGDKPRLLVSCRDVTEKHGLEQQLAYQASHDILTSLVNRREFERRLQRVLSTEGEPGDEHALCFLDLDQFKTVNDTCGHIAGDDLLRQVATLLQGQMRSRDTLARLGGDEFVVLMEYCSPERAKRFADKIQSSIRDFRFRWRSREYFIGVSIGIVPVQAGHSITDTINLADAACYAAKKAGGRRVHFYHPDDPLPAQ